MKRISYWVLSTVSALVLLFGYHTSLAGALATSAATSFQASAAPTSGSASASTSSPSDSSATSHTTKAPTPAKTKTVTGSVVQTQWGPVQVQIVVAGGKITKVGVLQYPQGNGHDAEINGYALPILTKETINAGSAQIDMVSGATVTSTGYIGSLQSAVDKANL